MEELELTKEMKLYILSKAKEYLEKESSHTCETNGICNAIRIQIRNRFPENSRFLTCSSDIKYFIPEFTFKNVFKLSSIHELKTPIDLIYWWNKEDFETRISFIEVLIKELKKD